MFEPKPLQQVDRTYVRFNNRKLSYFAGCDYFRMASHPAVLRAVSEGMKKFGLSVAASRLTTGNHAVYGELETVLQKFFGVPSATIVSNGYATNLVVAQALRGEFSRVFIDATAHVSLKDASKYFDCPVTSFKHQDVKDLARLIGKKSDRIIILTDGMSSHDGTMAPLREYLKLLSKDGVLLVDDAHGAAILGKTGKGTPELAGIPRDRVIQTITMSKAFGAYGGAILGPSDLREKIIQRSGMFAGSTPLPLPLAWAAKKSIEVLGRTPAIRERLHKNVRYIKAAVRGTNFAAPDTLGPILSYAPKDNDEVEPLKKSLLAHGVFPSFIQYPGGPENGYFRFVICSEHTKKQLDDLIAAITLKK